MQPQANAFAQAQAQHMQQLGQQQDQMGQAPQMGGPQDQGQQGQGPTFAHYSQLPNVQKGLAIVGNFLNGIGHPLAGIFDQFHAGVPGGQAGPLPQMGGFSAAAIPNNSQLGQTQ